jgi:hypothetical protein
MRLLLLMLGISVCVVGVGTRAEAQNYPWCVPTEYTIRAPAGTASTKSQPFLSVTAKIRSSATAQVASRYSPRSAALHLW